MAQDPVAKQLFGNGAACIDDGQCTSGYCDSGTYRCADPAAGSRCPASRQCPAETTCHPVLRRCVAPAALQAAPGESCASDLECTSAQYCSRETRLCVPLGSAYAPCSAEEGRPCGSGLVCVNSKCRRACLTDADCPERTSTGRMVCRHNTGLIIGAGQCEREFYVVYDPDPRDDSEDFRKAALIVGVPAVSVLFVLVLVCIGVCMCVRRRRRDRSALRGAVLSPGDRRAYAKSETFASPHHAKESGMSKL